MKKFFSNPKNEEEPQIPDRRRTEMDFCEKAIEHVKLTIERFNNNLESQEDKFIFDDRNKNSFAKWTQELKTKIKEIDESKDFAVEDSDEETTEQQQSPRYKAALKEYEHVKEKCKKSIGEKYSLKANLLAGLENSLEGYQKELASLMNHQPTTNKPK